ncbi:MAG: beta-ketoacyl synthase N-terminal-like domain-containing protein, partial [Nostoc sp.]
MVKVCITGIGLVSALGGSLEDSWRNLIAGKSGIRLHQPFPELTPLPLGLIGQQPSELTMLTQIVVASALKDSGLVPHAADCAVVIGSSRSYQASWEMLARQMYGDAANLSVPSFGSWLDTLPQMNAIAAARQIGASGIVLAPMAACATGIWSIA